MEYDIKLNAFKNGKDVSVRYYPTVKDGKTIVRSVIITKDKKGNVTKTIAGTVLYKTYNGAFNRLENDIDNDLSLEIDIQKKETTK